jgi:hypothetical protein
MLGEKMRKFNILLKAHPETFEPVMYVDIIGEGGGIGHYKFSMSLSSQVYHSFESDKGMQRLNIIEGMIKLNNLMELTQDEKDDLLSNKESIKIGEEKMRKINVENRKYMRKFNVDTQISSSTWAPEITTIIRHPDGAISKFKDTTYAEENSKSNNVFDKEQFIIQLLALHELPELTAEEKEYMAKPLWDDNFTDKELQRLSGFEVIKTIKTFSDGNYTNSIVDVTDQVDIAALSSRWVDDNVTVKNLGSIASYGPCSKGREEEYELNVKLEAARKQVEELEAALKGTDTDSAK